MRRGNAIIYRIDLRKYMMYSKGIEVALRRYDPILPTTLSSLLTLWK